MVGVAGVVALVTQRQGAGGGGASLVGDLLVFAALVCSALGQILGRYINRGEPQPLVTAALQVTGALPVAGLAALLLAAGPIGLVAAPGRALAEVAWLVLVPTVVNFFAYNIALSRLPVGWISLYVCLVPAVSTVLAALYLGAAVGPWEVAAIGVIVAGVALPSAERVRRARRDAAAAMASGGAGGR
ncbi:MAG TPA: EamA family transporter [Geminicoccaceae bacterium]|nr:EamA family transporter [Geminicoccaceae bacterium]